MCYVLTLLVLEPAYSNVAIMSTDAMDPCITGIVIMPGKLVLVAQKEGFQQSTPSDWW